MASQATSNKGLTSMTVRVSHAINASLPLEKPPFPTAQHISAPNARHNESLRSHNHLASLENEDENSCNQLN
jgi:hypothetical protein